MQVNKELIKNGIIWGGALIAGASAYKHSILAFDKFVPKAISKIHLTKAVASTVMSRDDEDKDDDYDY